MIAILEWEIRAADITLEVISGNVSIDDQNVPAITASLLVPYDATVAAALDPRQTVPPRVTLTARMTEWASGPISAITTFLASATTIAGITARWPGTTLGDISSTFGGPLHAGASTTPTEMSFDLHVREIDDGSYDMTVSLASDEALLPDWAPTDGLDFGRLNDYQEGIPDQQVRKWVDPILQLVLGRKTDVNAYSTANLTTVYTDVINRTLDMSGWDMLRQPLDDADLKLRVNRDGAGFSMLPPNDEIPGKAWSAVLTDDDVLTARRVRTRSEEWYDSVGLVAGDAAGTRVFKGGPTGTHSRTYRERFPDGTKLTSAMVRNIIKRTANRGRFLDIRAPIILGIFMMDEFTYTPDGGAPEPWVVKSINYDVMSGEMAIRAAQPY